MLEEPVRLLPGQSQTCLSASSRACHTATPDTHAPRRKFSCLIQTAAPGSPGMAPVVLASQLPWTAWFGLTACTWPYVLFYWCRWTSLNLGTMKRGGGLRHWMSLVMPFNQQWHLLGQDSVGLESLHDC